MSLPGSLRTFLDDGHEYVTAADIRERWDDVSAGLLRTWVSRGWLAVVLDPSGERVRVAVPGRRGGRANLYRWADVVAAELRARQDGLGRPRGS